MKLLKSLIVFACIVEEQAFHDAGEDDERLQQLLVVLGRASLERRIGQRVDERDQELVLVADRLHFVVRVEDLGLVQAQRFNDVLIGVRVDRLFKRLAQQVLAAFRRGDLAIRAEHDVVGGQRIGSDEETEVALDDAALVVGQAVRILPQRYVARHLDFLRHPVVSTGGEIFFPGPFVFERHQLVDVCLAVDDALVGNVDAAHFSGGRRLGRQRGQRSRGNAGHGISHGLQAERGGVWTLFRIIFELQHGLSPLLMF